MKKIISILLSISLVFIFTISTYAAENTYSTILIDGQTYSMFEIAQKSHLNIDKLQEYYNEHPYEFINDVYELYENSHSTYANADSSNSVSSLNILATLGRKGDMLISGQNSHTLDKLNLTYRHGHAAILYDAQTIVHARGPGLLSIKQSLSYFGTTNCIRLYTVNGVTNTTASNVAIYADNTLTGKEYVFDANSDTSSGLNCATLIYKAYKHYGINLKTYFYTVTPESLVEDTKTLVVAHVGWPGNQHSFDV